MASMLGTLTAQDRERFQETTALTLAVPEIRARALDEFARTLDVITTALAARSGREPDDFQVRILAGAIFGVILATTLPTLEKGQVEIDDIFASVDAGLAQLQARLPL